MDVRIIKMPYTGARNVPERSRGPDHLEQGLASVLGGAGVVAPPVETVALTPVQDASERGRWHRMGLACGRLAAGVTGHLRRGCRVIGLLGNCTAALGMLAGLQGAVGDRKRIGLVWLDAHADFNTPETTLSGMLGGMPAAVAAGLCLHRLRREAGLDPPVRADRIVMAGLRDVDPLEQALLDEHGVVQLDVEGLTSHRFTGQVGRLASASEAVYVHVDMDVLDPEEVRGHPLTVAGGPSSETLAALLRPVFAEPRVVALGVASAPSADADPEGTARRAAHRLIASALPRA